MDRSRKRSEVTAVNLNSSRIETSSRILSACGAEPNDATSNSFLKKLDPSSAFIFIVKRQNYFCVHTTMLPLEVILKD